MRMNIQGKFYDDCFVYFQQFGNQTMIFHLGEIAILNIELSIQKEL